VRRAAALLAAALAATAPRLVAQARPAISPDTLRRLLRIIADDSMGGRGTGSRGDFLAAAYVAATFERLGLEPAGEHGTYFQTVPPSAWEGGPVAYPARNVIAVLRGRDPRLNHTYVSITAHNDHLGIARVAVDHDSIRAYDRVVRPAGADSPRRAPTAAEAARIRVILDSLRAIRPPRRDSIYNGADDDGSGTVGLLEIARTLAAGPRPRRSIVFVSHAAEELGDVGSEWYTDHATLPIDSFVGEIDIDMISRGDAGDVQGGGPRYIEIVGSKRLSTEFGTLLETVNASLPEPFAFNYQFDAPGDPNQYYCRADHYSYARYGVPSVSISTGLHLDYHQVTDEPQYVDYGKLARVATLTRAMALAVADLDHRAVIDGRRTDPHAPCVQ